MASDCVRGRVIYFTLESQEKNNMRKTLLLATILLLGSMGAAQAQAANRHRQGDFADLYGAGSQEGGKNEAAGDVFLDITGNPKSIASYTLTYSVPVMQVPTTLTGYDSTESDLEKGLVAFGAIADLTGADLTMDTVIAITGITLDVSKADSGPVTVTLALENADEFRCGLFGRTQYAYRHYRSLPESKSPQKMDTHKDPGRGSYGHVHN